MRYLGTKAMVADQIKAKVEVLLRRGQVIRDKLTELKARCRHPQKFMRWESDKTHCLCGSEFWPQHYGVYMTVGRRFLLSEVEINNASHTRETLSELLDKAEEELKRVRSLCPHPEEAKIPERSPEFGAECGICQQEYWEIEKEKKTVPVA